MDLPNELLFHITSFLVYPDIANFSQTCNKTYQLFSTIRDRLPWKITTIRTKDNRVNIRIKVGWFDLIPDLDKISEKWSGKSKRIRKSLCITTQKGFGGPLLVKILGTKEPYVEFNSEGEVIDVHHKKERNTFPASLVIGYLHPRYCSSHDLTSLFVDDILITS